MPVDRAASDRLPQGCRLLVVGTPGRESARLDARLVDEADALAEHGVTVLAAGTRSVRAALDAAADEAPHPLVQALSTAGPGTVAVLSDESLAAATPAELSGLPTLLGGPVHVVVDGAPDPWVDLFGPDAVTAVGPTHGSPGLSAELARLLDLPTEQLVPPAGDAPEPPVLEGVWWRRAQEPVPAPLQLTEALLDAAAGALDRGAAGDAGTPSEVPLDGAADALYAAFRTARDEVAAAGRPVRRTVDELRPLPVGTTLLHVGLPAAGSDVVQRSWRAWSTAALPGARVAYPGARDSHDVLAACLLAGSPEERAELPAAIGRLLPPQEAEGAQPVTHVLSAERLALADARRVRALVAALRAAGGTGLHVVLTLRNVPELLVAAWQHTVTSGSGHDLDTWLRTAFQDDGSVRMPGLDALGEADGTSLVARWADAVGPAHVTVVVERDEGRDTLAVLARLAGLGHDAVDAVPSTRALTARETELIRAFNAHLPYRATVPPAQRRLLVRRGAIAGLLAGTRPDDADAALPAWALAPAQAAGRRLEEQVGGLPVTVVGDLSVLADVPSSTEGMPAAEDLTVLHRSSVEAALLGMFDRAVRFPEPEPVVAPAPASPRPSLRHVPTRAIARELVGRVTGRRAGAGEVRT